MTATELDDYARSLCSGDGKELCAVISSLVESGSQADCERIARILSFAPIGGGAGGDYYAARYGKSFDKRYLDFFLDICKSSHIPESEYVKVLLAAGSAPVNSDLHRWNPAVDVYLTRRTNEDYGLVEGYIEAYDRRYTKYYILIRRSPDAALSHLINKLLFEKNVDKTAIRDALMDHSELAEPLMSLYSRSLARERAAILRLLLLYKNDATVRDFIEETVKSDKSKTVKAVLDKKSDKKLRIGDATAFFEKAMINGTPYTAKQWREILKNKKCAAVADRTFFCTKDGETEILLYNDGGFIGTDDAPKSFRPDKNIYVLHPLDIPDGSEVAELRIAQPFVQLGRRVFSPPRDEEYTSSALGGSIIERADFDANIKKLGFVMCGKRAAGDPTVVVCFVGEYAVGVECELAASTNTAGCVRLSYYRAADIVKLNRTYYVSSVQPVIMRRIPRREYSELTLAAYRLFCRD